MTTDETVTRKKNVRPSRKIGLHILWRGAGVGGRLTVVVATLAISFRALAANKKNVENKIKHGAGFNTTRQLGRAARRGTGRRVVRTL